MSSREDRVDRLLLAREIEEFLYGESEREFTRSRSDINWFDEGKETLARRVKQIETGIHWAEEPVSRISHLISNVQILEATPSAGEAREVAVKCRFLIYRN